MIAHKAHLVSPAFWKGKRVFLTGHTGFKGSWISQWLCDMGAELRGYSTDPEWHIAPKGSSRLFDELGLADKMDHIPGDVRDRAHLTEALRAFTPEIVIHMAAQPLVRLSYREPVETYETNVMGTVNLLAACQNLPGLRTIVVVSSDKCYENREQIWGYRESDPMGGHDPYSNSKGCTELVTAAFRSSFFSPARHDDHGVVLCSGRAGNVIGGGDWSLDRLIPDVFRARAEGQEVVIRNPQATRPWQHVIDPVAGYLRLAEQSYETPVEASNGWNFGPSETMTVSVGELMVMLEETLPDGLRWRIETLTDQPHEARLLKLDCTAAQKFLHWHPSFDMAQTIRMVTDWYGNPDTDTRRALVAQQLAEVT